MFILGFGFHFVLCRVCGGVSSEVVVWSVVVIQCRSVLLGGGFLWTGPLVLSSGRKARPSLFSPLGGLIPRVDQRSCHWSRQGFGWVVLQLVVLVVVCGDFPRTPIVLRTCLIGFGFGGAVGVVVGFHVVVVRE